MIHPLSSRVCQITHNTFKPVETRKQKIPSVIRGFSVRFSLSFKRCPAVFVDISSGNENLISHYNISGKEAFAYVQTFEVRIILYCKQTNGKSGPIWAYMPELRSYLHKRLRTCGHASSCTYQHRNSLSETVPDPAEKIISQLIG